MGLEVILGVAVGVLIYLVYFFIRQAIKKNKEKKDNSNTPPIV